MLNCINIICDSLKEVVVREQKFDLYTRLLFALFKNTYFKTQGLIEV